MEIEKGDTSLHLQMLHHRNDIFSFPLTLPPSFRIPCVRVTTFLNTREEQDEERKMEKVDV